MREMGEGDYLAVTATYDLLKLKFLPEMQRYFCDLFGLLTHDSVATKAIISSP